MLEPTVKERHHLQFRLRRLDDLKERGAHMDLVYLAGLAVLALAVGGLLALSGRLATKDQPTTHAMEKQQ